MGAGTSPADPASAGREADGPDSAAEGGSTATGNTEADGGAEAGRPVSGSEAGEPGSGATSAEPGGEAAAPAGPGGSRSSRGTPPAPRRRPGRPGDAPAPARQWPLLTVLCTAGAGLLIVALDPFAEAFRIGTILIGAALIAGAVLRWVVPSVGMLAVRSRFTDLVTYGLMGTLIVLLALVAQPKPWLDVPILEDAVRFTIR
ncbi:DUF3017 domain-containing protein [Streptomyces microflavus]